MEDAKTLFASLRGKAREAEFARMQLKELQTAAAKCTPVMHLAPSGGGGEKRILENNVIQIEQAERKLQDCISDYSAYRLYVLNFIETLKDPLLEDILQMRYVENMTWVEIAMKQSYSVSYVRKLKDEALARLDRKLKSGALSSDK